MTTRAPSILRPARLALLIAIAAGAIALAHLADRAILERIHNPNATDADWGRMLRIAGYFPTWLLVAAAFALIDSGRGRTSSFSPPLRDRWSRASLLFCAVSLAGIVDEALKLVIRRERPSLEHATYVFRPFSESPWSTSGLGMPSSHAAIAFAAGAILWRLYPRAWPVWLTLSAGCAATRVLARAHFFSDVVAGAVVGIGAAAIIWAIHSRPLRRPEHAS